MSNIFNKIAGFFRAFGQLCKKSREDNPPIRIVDMQNSKKNNQAIFVVQIADKNIFLRYTADEILKDHRLSKLLSIEDLVLVEKNTSNSIQNKIDFKITAFEFLSDDNDYLYTIRLGDDGKVLVRDFLLQELVNNMLVFGQLDDTDKRLLHQHQQRIEELN